MEFISKVFKKYGIVKEDETDEKEENQESTNPKLLQLCHENIPEIRIHGPSSLFSHQKENEENIPKTDKSPRKRRSVLKYFDPLYVESPKPCSPCESRFDETCSEIGLGIEKTSNVDANITIIKPHSPGELSQSKFVIPFASDIPPITNTSFDFIADSDCIFINVGNKSDLICIENPQTDENTLVLEDITSILNSVLKKVEEKVNTQSVTVTEEESPNTVVEDTMADLNDTLVSDEETANLKLKLNASQQALATLELQVIQKEEIIIKTQAECLRKEQAYKTEIASLKEKVEEYDKYNNKDTKEMEETIKHLKAKEAKLTHDFKLESNEFLKVMEEWDKTFEKHVADHLTLKEEHETVKQHLSALELAFSDVHQKYERAKTIITGFKSNEDTLRQDRVEMEDTIKKSVEKYESLKAHAQAQIEKCNKEILLVRDKYEAELMKLNTMVKRLEIKNSSIIKALDQKTVECSALAALCDEVTGKV